MRAEEAKRKKRPLKGKGLFLFFFLAILGFVAVNLAQILPSHGSGTEHRESGVSGGRIAAGAQEAELRSIAHG